MIDLPKLSDLRRGESAVIHGIHAPDAIRLRLQAMGLRTGKVAEIIRRSRLGPMHVRIGNVDLIMRQRDASRIAIVPAR